MYRIWEYTFNYCKSKIFFTYWITFLLEGKWNLEIFEGSLLQNGDIYWLNLSENAVKKNIIFKRENTRLNAKVTA